jgi:hypothetical protein
MVRAFKILFTFRVDEFLFASDLIVFTISIIIIAVYSFYLYLRTKRHPFNQYEYQSKIKDLSYTFGKILIFFGVIFRSNGLYSAIQGNPFEELQAVMSIYWLLFSIGRLIFLYYLVLIVGFLMRKLYVGINLLNKE